MKLFVDNKPIFNLWSDNWFNKSNDKLQYFFVIQAFKTLIIFLNRSFGCVPIYVLVFPLFWYIFASCLTISEELISGTFINDGEVLLTHGHFFNSPIVKLKWSKPQSNVAFRVLDKLNLHFWQKRHLDTFR
jgi:hypothetical protein